jgi:phenylalanyl-tRNA synthetase beta chain
MLVDLAGARMTAATDVHEGLPERPVVHLRTERADQIIGLEVSPEEQEAILGRLGFEVSGGWDVTVPTWRARDVTREIDLVEEVARVVLDRVPRTMPARRAVAGHLSREQRLRRLVEDVLVGAGVSEAYTWSLVAADDDPGALRLPDPMTPEQAVLRTSLLSGLVDSARHNVDCGNSPVRLFEIARVYLPSGEQLPDERWHVGAIVDGGFDAARTLAELLYGALHLPLEPRRGDHRALHPGKAAATDDGVFGELHPTLLEGTWGYLELDLERLTAGIPERTLYQDVITYPAVRQDIAVVVAEDVPAGDLASVAREAAGPLLGEVTPFDVFRGSQLGEGRKSVALHLVFQAPDRTLTDDDAAALRTAVVEALARRFDAELRSG